MRWRGNKHQEIVTMIQKRRLHQTLPIGKRLKATKPKPKHYDCPETYAYVEPIKGRTRVRVLLDSGSNIFLINQNLVKNLHIPYETRQTALPMLTFVGTNASYQENTILTLFYLKLDGTDNDPTCHVRLHLPRNMI